MNPKQFILLINSVLKFKLLINYNMTTAVVT